jgi:hypothetical protein
MIVASAICPSPPLLAAELTGQADILPELRAACAAAVTRLLAAGPDLVAVTGLAEATGAWDPGGVLSLPSFAPALRRGRPLDSPLPLPLALGVGALLLDEAGYAGPRAFHGIAEGEPAAACLALGRRIAASAPRVALLAVGDGTARRSASAPGYLDERAAPFDDAVEAAVRDGDLSAIAALDPALAADLLAAGRPAWQALAGALTAARPPAPRQATDAGARRVPGLTAARPRTEVLYSGAPFGVAYLVATLLPRIEGA